MNRQTAPSKILQNCLERGRFVFVLRSAKQNPASDVQMHVVQQNGVLSSCQTEGFHIFTLRQQRLSQFAQIVATAAHLTAIL